MQTLTQTLQLQLLKTLYDAYIKLGLFKGNPLDNTVCNHLQAAFELGSVIPWPGLDNCFKCKNTNVRQAFFSYVYLTGNLNKRKFNYLMSGDPRTAKLILVDICGARV